MVLSDNGIDQKPAGIGQHQPGNTVDDHQDKAQREQTAPGTHQGPDLRQNSAESLDFGGFLGWFRVGIQSLVGLRHASIRFIITVL